MSKIQCKMCGGELNLPDNVASGNCEYCGCLVTFPKISSEYLENLYNRAEHFRHINDYDKAIAAYEKIINANPDDPEAYWGLVLSKFGIEYVEDPITHERIPTCHRVQFESILTDADYLAALERAGSIEKDIYETEAGRIAQIQKDILSISNQEEPFDVFICYKENDNGRRTKDSVAAQDVYYALQREGLKVFFARITLEHKLGQQYEPYIFAALNSAQAMLVIGSKPEYFNAVWVRNEWSRYLSLMKRDRSKLLIPCYKDMDAYDIPEELSIFQAQDMGKIGFIQDILHGVKKVIVSTKSSVTHVASSHTEGKTNPLLRRAQLFLETGDFESAKSFCEKVLNQEPENGWGYFFRGMAELKISDEKKLSECDLNEHKSFQFAQRFADNELKVKIDQIVVDYREKLRIEEEKKQKYQEAWENDNQLRIESEKRYYILRRLLRAERLLNAKNPILNLLNECIKRESDLCKNDDLLTSEFVKPIKEHSEQVILAAGDLGKKERLMHKIIAKRVFVFVCIVFIIIFAIIAILRFAEHMSVQKGNVCKIEADMVTGIKFSSENITKCVIPEGITKIAAYAFCNCNNLQSVFIPDSVNEIGRSAFGGCNLLKEIIVPFDCEIGDEAFPSNCKVIKLDPESRKLYKSASNGDTESQYLLAIRYSQGKGVGLDGKEMIKWLCKAAENGHAEAQRILGNCYNKGLFVTKNSAEAMKWWHKAAEQENIDAQVSLGYCYYVGDGIAKNNIEAMKWWRKAAEQGNAYSQFALGQCYYKDGNYAEAIKWYRKSAEQKDADAQNMLGKCYYNGEGVEKNYSEAVKWLKKAVVKGNPSALFNLAWCYYNGEGVEKNYTEAVKLLKKAAEKQNPDAQYLLGKCYYNGEGVEKNHPEAVKLFTKAAEKQNTDAQNMLGTCYYRGEGVEKNYTEAVKLLSKAAEKQNPDAQYLLGKCYYNGEGVEKSYAEAVKLLSKAAEKQNPDAQYLLGKCYYNGEGIEKNYTEAVKLLKKAAEKQNPDAQYLLGKCYYNGEGVEKNYTKSIKLLLKAAEKGHADAQGDLGACYYSGTGVEKSYTEAVKWWQHASEQNCVNAQFFLSICYYAGDGIEKNDMESAKWLQKAAERGHTEAQATLGAYYYTGIGVKKNYLEAVKWYREAAIKGYGKAQCQLGNCYYAGHGVIKNYEEAARWYRKAAENDYADAQRILGNLYYMGNGVEKDYSEAAKWYRKAAENGHADAQRILGYMYYNGNGVDKDYVEAVKWYRKAIEQGNDKAKERLNKSELFLSTVRKLADDENIDAKYIIAQFDAEQEAARIKRINAAEEQGLSISGDGKIVTRFDGNSNGICFIPEGVIEIRYGAFSQRNLQRITISSSVKKIGDYAFSHCKELKNVAIFEGLEEIGAYAFVNCSNLQEITIPRSVKKIGIRAFDDCTSLKEVRIPRSCKYYIDRKANTFPRKRSFPLHCKITKY